MRCEPACVTLVVLLAAQVAFADPLVPDSPLGCPPSKTETVNPSGNASLVLAAGSQFGVVRVAGPFNSPWSVAFLPDGSFLVTERPRKLQLVRLGD